MKRLIDIVAAVCGLILLSPVMISIALAARLAIGAPVLFRQQRPGLHGKPFHLLKFRTMLDAVDANGRPLHDKERLVRFGSTLRATSLDELPQLWNVLRGDMSLVGPRPLLMHYLPLYSSQQARRHEVRPGLTGWAQITGRNALSWDEKFAADLWYVDNRSLWLDLKILARTAVALFRRRGIAAEGHVTMPEFRGSADDAPNGTTL